MCDVYRVVILSAAKACPEPVERDLHVNDSYPPRDNP
jgi:hypothetical protein